MDFISLDLETTGLSPKLDKIIEIGAVKYVDNEPVERFSSFVNPGRKLEERVVSLTGITDCDVEKAPKASEVVPKLLEFCGDLPLVGHRILFDYSFVKQEAANLKLSFEKKGVDTLKIARACHPELESKRLGDMCKHYGIELKAHRACNDAMATAELFFKLKDGFEGKYPEMFEPKELIYKVKKEGPASKAQLERLAKLIERTGENCPYDLKMLSKNEASRYYDKLRAKYGM